MQNGRNRATFVRQDSFDDTASEGYSSRKCSDELQYESLSKSCRMNSGQRSESIPIAQSLPHQVSSSISSDQNSTEDSNSLSNVWKTANIVNKQLPNKLTFRQIRSCEPF